MSIAPFFRQVRARPHADAIVFPEMTFSFEQMNRLAMAFAGRMSSAGVGTNSTLTLQSSEPSVVLATLLAASHLGASIVQDNDGLILPKELSVTHHFHTVEAGRTPAEGSMLIDSAWSPAYNSGNLPKQRNRIATTLGFMSTLQARLVRQNSSH